MNKGISSVFLTHFFSASPLTENDVAENKPVYFETTYLTKNTQTIYQ